MQMILCLVPLWVILLKKELFPKFPTCSQDMANVSIQAQKQKTHQVSELWH